MAATLIMWGHALAALLFVAAALAVRARAPFDLPRGALAAALAITALWALAVAGIDARHVSVRALVGIRDIAWLAAMLVLARRLGKPGSAVIALYAAVTGVMLLAAAIAVIEARLGATGLLIEPRLWLRVLALLGALILVTHLYAEATAVDPGIRLVAIAAGLMWVNDLFLLATGLVEHGWPVDLVGARGGVMALVALLVWIGATQQGGRALAVSRPAAIRLLSLVGLAAYAGLTALLTAIAELVGGEQARIAQTAVIFGATAALLTLISTPWLNAWMKVTLAKHLFGHRYDYRAEWQRFGETLAAAAPADAPLGERLARAIADLTVSPAALLLVAEGETLVVAAASRWPDPPAIDDAATLAQHLAASGRIIEIDAVRAGDAPADAAAVPAALLARADAWAIVPLAHRGGLVGAVVVARPPVDRALDWEDFDLLRVAGRQAAGALAEDRARRALADAERFEEFNRRFAFILHDIKNLVSQLSLVARNAERHADNPVFRADMIATLRESSGRMQALLARLAPQAGRREPARPIAAAELLGRIAARHRGDHVVRCEAADGVWLVADPAGLETVIEHLLQNAADASAPAQAITLSAHRHGGEVAIEVVDRGAGMSAGFVREQLFRPFVSTKPEGFGLGAFEARQLVEAMGGRIEVASREGEGTRVTLRLPAADALEVAA